CADPMVHGVVVHLAQQENLGGKHENGSAPVGQKRPIKAAFAIVVELDLAREPQSFPMPRFPQGAAPRPVEASSQWVLLARLLGPAGPIVLAGGNSRCA